MTEKGIPKRKRKEKPDEELTDEEVLKSYSRKKLER